MIEPEQIVREAMRECSRRGIEPCAVNAASILSQWLAEAWKKKPGFDRGTQAEVVRVDSRPKTEPL